MDEDQKRQTWQGLIGAGCLWSAFIIGTGLYLNLSARQVALDLVISFALYAVITLVAYAPVYLWDTYKTWKKAREYDRFIQTEQGQSWLWVQEMIAREYEEYVAREQGNAQSEADA